MIQIIIKRMVKGVDCPDGTFGVVWFEGRQPFCVSLERKWKDNKKGESCIPPGEYLCKHVTSPKFGNTFEVTSVPERSEILFHKGNIDDDSHGCIILGEEFGELNGKTAVLSSGYAFEKFMLKLNWRETEFKLIIEEV